MITRARLGYFFIAILLCVTAGWTQQQSSAAQSPGSKIYLDVVVAPKSGAPVAGLQQQDFTVLDNKVPRTITSFKAVEERNAPIEIVLVIDTVNIGAQTIDYERIQIDKFLRSDAGNLAYPVTLAILTDTGVQMVGNGFSSDGNALSAMLEKETVGFRDIGRSSGYWGATERWQASLDGLGHIVSSEARRPGRKLIICISPGWPLLNVPGAQTDAREQQNLFSSIVGISTDLRVAGVTLDSVDPQGAGASTYYASAYEQFLKGISKPNQAQPGDLALQVLAVQSGGVALGPDNDIAGLLQKCVASAAPYYEITFDAPEADGPNEYHHLEVKVDKPGVTARTREEYYAQPAAAK